MPAVPDPSGNWFVAFPVVTDPGLPGDILAGAPPGLRPFHPADLHLTLAFLGRLAPERVSAVRSHLATLEVPALAAVAESLVLLPSARRPSVLALILGDGADDGADLLARTIVHNRPALLAAAGRPPDTRPPLPHLTIARLPRTTPSHAAVQHRSAACKTDGLGMSERPIIDKRVADIPNESPKAGLAYLPVVPFGDPLSSGFFPPIGCAPD